MEQAMSKSWDDVNVYLQQSIIRIAADGKLNNAISDGNTGVVKLLLKRAKNLKNNNRYLNDAIKSYHDSRYEIAKLLVDAKVNPNSPDSDGNPMIFRFLSHSSWDETNKSGYSENYEVITRFKKRLNFKIENKKGENLLRAVLNGRKDIDVARYFIKNKVDIEDADPDKQTLLHAIAKGRGTDNAGMLRLLLEHNADINRKDNDGNTPLHIAVGRYQPYIISLLLNYGADSQIKNVQGETPLDVAKDNSFTYDFFVFYEKLLSTTKLDDYAEMHRRMIANKGCYIVDIGMIQKLNLPVAPAKNRFMRPYVKISMKKAIILLRLPSEILEKPYSP